MYDSIYYTIKIDSKAYSLTGTEQKSMGWHTRLQGLMSHWELTVLVLENNVVL